MMDWCCCQQVVRLDMARLSDVTIPNLFPWPWIGVRSAVGVGYFNRVVLAKEKTLPPGCSLPDFLLAAFKFLKISIIP